MFPAFEAGDHDVRFSHLLHSDAAVDAGQDEAFAVLANLTSVLCW